MSVEQSIIDELVTVGEAAALLRVAVPTVRMWLRFRRLQRVKIGRRTMITRTELLRFVATSNPVVAKK